MKTKLKSILAAALCAVGFAAFAAPLGTGTEDDPWEIGMPTAGDVEAWTNGTGRLEINAPDGESATMDFDTSAPWAGGDLTEAVVGAGVTVIGKNAFAGCPALKTLVLNDQTPPMLGKGNDFTGVKIFVPTGAADAYRAAWSDFANEILEMPHYLDWDEANKTLTNVVCKVGEFKLMTSDATTLEAGTTYVVLGNVTNTAKRITVNGTVANPTRLILCDGAELVAKKGIEVKVNGATTNALTICGQEGGTGALEALFDSAMAAGIGGGGYEVAGGLVTINGGTVTATGGDAATGIGGGTEGAGGIVTINGGSVTATGWTGFGAGRSAGTLDPGTVTFGEGVLFSVVTGKTAAVTAPIAQEDYEKDHSAAYVHIAPAKQEISAVSAEGFLDLTVGDRVAEAEEPIVADPKWGNGERAYVKIDGEDPAREYPELSIDKWFTSALTAGRYGMTFTSGDTNETAVFWKTGANWEVLDLPPYSTAGIEFQADKTYLALGQYEFAGTAPLTVLDGAKFEYGTGAGFKGGTLEMPRRYRKETVEGGPLYRIVEAIKGCEDNPWDVGVGIEAYTNGTDNLVIVGEGTIADLSEIPSEVKRGIAAITVGDGVTDAAAGVFFGFDGITVTLQDNWKGELQDEKSTWCGATNVELTRVPKAVKNVKVQQRYPWNGKVDVDFDLTGEGSVKVTLSVTVDGKKLKNPTVVGGTTFDLGTGMELKDLRLTWDAGTDFGDDVVHEKIKVKLTVSPAEAD